MKTIIGVIGKKQTGKDTLSTYIMMKYRGTLVALAKGVKETCRALFGFTDEQLYGKKKEVIDSCWGISPRQTFQWIGTEIVQFELPKIPGYLHNRCHWCYLTQKEIERLEREGVFTEKRPVIITDIRFLHEQRYFQEFAVDSVKFVTIKLVRDTGFIDNHSSEKESDSLEANYIIENNGSLPELYKKFDALEIL